MPYLDLVRLEVKSLITNYCQIILIPSRIILEDLTKHYVADLDYTIFLIFFFL